MLIIGGGDSGTRTARELAQSHVVTLSARSRHRHHRCSTFAPSAAARGDWLDLLRQTGVTIAPGSVGVDGPNVLFEDGSRAKPQSVIFATGYPAGDRWLPQSVRDTAHRGLRRGMKTMPGLFVAGFPRHGRYGSDTLVGVHQDAAAIARRIMNRP